MGYIPAEGGTEAEAKQGLRLGRATSIADGLRSLLQAVLNALC